MTDSIAVKTFVLENGLTVILNEDHSEPKVFGAVVVKVGSKNDPEGSTGMAHYFEHIMFKGTDKIGTTDYKNEKLLLDSISDLYDKHLYEKDLKKKQEILIQINELSIQASEFAIPNETDKLLKEYGGTKVNAYTSFDQTVFFNMFPSTQIERWLDIYAERFKNPVFRLFQSELETVYEERNMYSDQTGSKAIEDIFKLVFPKHPYHNPIIGTVNDLKNPSPNKMMQFFKDHYVAGNMALIISGDFDTENTLAMIRSKFGKWISGEAPKFDKEKYTENPFKGREFHAGRYIPIKAGAVVYRGVPNGHEDMPVLDYCCKILSNDSQTGMLDKLRSENKVMMTGGYSIQLNDEGIIGLFFVPKIVGSSLRSTEKEVMKIIDQLKSGNFDDSFFESLKMHYVRDKEQSVETIESRGNLLTTLFAGGYTWNEYLKQTAEYKNITKEDVVKAANKYFTDNRLVFYNRTGFSSKAEKIKKPPIKPIPVKNTDKESVFAQELKLVKEWEITPAFIEKGNDFIIEELKPKLQLVTSKNTVNNVFTMGITFEAGVFTNKYLEFVAHLDDLGTNEKTVDEFRKSLQNLGATMNISAEKRFVNLTITGFDDKFEQTIKLVDEFISDVKPDNKQMAKVIDYVKGRNKIERKDQNMLSEASFKKAVLGDNSEFLNRHSLKEIKKIKSEYIVDAFRAAIGYETVITYTGKLSFNDVKTSLLNTDTFNKENLKSGEREFKSFVEYQENEIFIFNNKKANQTSIYFYALGENGSQLERLNANLFNQYFGSGMSSILFKEVRELRSLAYNVSANYKFSPKYFGDRKGVFSGMLSTQADKTYDAVSLMSELVGDMPKRPEAMITIKKSLRESVNSTKPVFRNVAEYGYNMVRNGYEADYRRLDYDNAEKAEFEDIVSFYEKFVANRPLIFVLTGNKSKMDIKKLSKYGKITELKLKDIMKF